MMKSVALTALATTLLTAGLAHADDVSLAPGNIAPTTTASTTSGAEGPKSADTALMLSLGGTAASIGLVVAGGAANNGGMVAAGLLSSLVTPSFGEWYAGKPLTAGMGIRVASAAAEIAGIAEALKCWDTENSCSSNDGAAGALMLGGLIGYAAGTIYDIADAPSSAREYNRAHGWHATVTPTVMRTPSGSTTMGVGLGGAF